MRLIDVCSGITKRLLAVLCVCGMVGSAQALPIQGEWDPAVGGPFPTLGWRGKAQFDIPVGCQAAGPVTITSSDPCVLSAPTGLQFVGATIEFYDITAGPSAPTLDKVVFGPFAAAINSIDILNYRAQKVDTAFTAFANTVGSITFNGIDLYGFALRFDSVADATLSWGLKSGSGYVGTPDANAAAGAAAAAPTVYTTPEPGTLFLVAAAVVLAQRFGRRQPAA